MSSSRRQSAAVYRRRRLAVFILAVLILGLVSAGVWAIVRVVTAPGDAAAPVPSVSAPAASDPAGSASADPSADTSTDPAEADASAEPTPTEPPGVQECAAANLVLTATTDKQEYGSEEIPQLGMTLQNVGGVDCIINVGTSQQVFTITSGQDTWWRSTDCQSEPADAIVTLAAGAIVSTEGGIPWDRSRSSTSTCDSDTRPRAPGGGASYHLSVSIGDISSASAVQFFLY